MPLIPTSKNFPSKEQKILLWHATETLQELMGLYPAEADEAKDRLASSASASRRIEILVTQILFRIAFGKDAALSRLPSGRPVAIGSTMHLSISHTHGLVALAASEHPIGIDVEAWGPRAMRLARKFLSIDEMAMLNDSPESTAVSLWSAKEAAFKLWDEPGTTLYEDIRLSNDGPTHLIATHTKAPHLKARVSIFPLKEAAFALATHY